MSHAGAFLMRQHEQCARRCRVLLHRSPGSGRCDVQSHVVRGSTPLVLAAALAGAALAPLGAQEPPAAAPPVAPYRAPVIALVQPPAGGSVPSDKPIVVFRF